MSVPSRVCEHPDLRQRSLDRFEMLARLEIERTDDGSVEGQGMHDRRAQACDWLAGRVRRRLVLPRDEVQNPSVDEDEAQSQAVLPQAQ